MSIRNQRIPKQVFSNGGTPHAKPGAIPLAPASLRPDGSAKKERPRIPRYWSHYQRIRGNRRGFGAKKAPRSGEHLVSLNPTSPSMK